MTLRLTPLEDDTLAQLASAQRMSKNSAAAAAISAAAGRVDHSEFVERTTTRLLRRYAGLMSLLNEA